MERAEIPAGLPVDIEDKKLRARGWFEQLRDLICAALEKIEDDMAGPQASWITGQTYPVNGGYTVNQ